jgi:hypothetical protein
MFIPSVIEEVGCSGTPWTNLDVQSLQGCMNLVYPGLGYIVEKGDALETSVSQFFLQSLRNMYLPSRRRMLES